MNEPHFAKRLCSRHRAPDWRAYFRHTSTLLLAVGLAGLCLALRAPAQSPDSAQTSAASKAMVMKMLANEDAALQNRDHYMYVSKERSDRTGGHLWTERVVETTPGKIRFLMEEDGRPLPPDRAAAERARLAAIVSDPAAFQRHEQAQKNDEAHATQMLTLLPKGFLFSEPREEGGVTRVDYRPNPEYTPQSLEERVLHGMSGTILIEPRGLRMLHVDGRLAEDVSIGFGLLATIHAGSSFATTRTLVGGPAAPEWKTTGIDINIDGKAIFFKVIAKKEQAEHTQFVRVPNDLSVAAAVEMAER